MLELLGVAAIILAIGVSIHLIVWAFRKKSPIIVTHTHYND